MQAAGAALAATVALPSTGTAMQAASASVPAMPSVPMSHPQIVQALQFMIGLRENLFNPSLSAAEFTALKQTSLKQVVSTLDQRYEKSLIWLIEHCGKDGIEPVAMAMHRFCSSIVGGTFLGDMDMQDFNAKIEALKGFEGQTANDLLEHFIGPKDEYIRTQVLRIYRPQTAAERKELVQETNRILVDSIMLPPSVTWKRYK